MASLTAPDIYANFHEQARGTDGLTSAQVTARQLSEWYWGNAVSVQRVIDGIRSGWQGDAAEAAAQGLAPLAENSYTTGHQLATAQDLLARQVGSFHTAAAEVQPVPPAPGLTDAIGAVMTGSSPEPILAKIAARHVIEQANVDAYTKYVAASQYNTTNLPPLADSVAFPGAPVSVVAPAAVASNGTTHLSSAPAAVPHTATTASATTPAAQGTPSRATASRPAAPASDPATGTTPSDSGSQVAAAPSGLTTAGPTTAGLRPQMFSDPASAEGAVSGAARPGSGIDANGGAAVRFVAAPPAPGTQSGEPVDGLVGGRSAAVEGSVRGAAVDDAASAGRGGGGESVPGGPVGRGVPREDERERRSRFVLAEDGETRFGTAERVAPAVIGDDSDRR